MNEDEGRLKLQSTISSSRRLLSEFKSREEEIQTLEAKAEQELAMLENSKQTKTAAKAAMAKDYGHLRSQIQHLREETTALSEDVKIQVRLLFFFGGATGRVGLILSPCRPRCCKPKKSASKS